jgi:hypothetical protein
LWHIVCTTVTGDVYAFAGNQFGQLGTGGDQVEMFRRFLIGGIKFIFEIDKRQCNHVLISLCNFCIHTSTTLDQATKKAPLTHVNKKLFQTITKIATRKKPKSIAQGLYKKQMKEATTFRISNAISVWRWPGSLWLPLVAICFAGLVYIDGFMYTSTLKNAPFVKARLQR